MFINRGALPVQIDLDELCVIVPPNPGCIQPPATLPSPFKSAWAQVNGGAMFTLESTKTLVLTETENDVTGEFNFDTSEFRSAANPHVTVKVSTEVGTKVFDFEDTKRVLFGNEDAGRNPFVGGTAETTPYMFLDQITFPAARSAREFFARFGRLFGELSC
jgi:hypothetical protein